MSNRRMMCVLTGRGAVADDATAARVEAIASHLAGDYKTTDAVLVTPAASFLARPPRPWTGVWLDDDGHVYRNGAKTDRRWTGLALGTGITSADRKWFERARIEAVTTMAYVAAMGGCDVLTVQLITDKSDGFDDEAINHAVREWHETVKIATSHRAKGVRVGEVSTLRLHDTHDVREIVGGRPA